MADVKCYLIIHLDRQNNISIRKENIINKVDAFAQSALLGSVDNFYADFGLESLFTAIRTSYCVFLSTVEVAEYFHSCIWRADALWQKKKRGMKFQISCISVVMGDSEVINSSCQYHYLTGLKFGASFHCIRLLAGSDRHFPTGHCSIRVQGLTTSSFFMTKLLQKSSLTRFVFLSNSEGRIYGRHTDMLLIRQADRKRRKRRTDAKTPMSEIKTTQQFSPQVNTKVDGIVTVVSENLFSGPRILAIISLFHYHLHWTDGFFHHSTVKGSLSCNTRFPYCLSHRIKRARNTSTTRNPQHSHRYFTSGKLRDT